MFRRSTVKLDPLLWERVRRCAREQGYATPAEFVVHLVEKAIADHDERSDEEQHRRLLRGLGYLR